MSYLLVALGAVIGVMISGFPGFLFGGAIGLLLSNSYELRKRVARFESELASITKRMTQQERQSADAQSAELKTAYAKTAHAQTAHSETANLQASDLKAADYKPTDLEAADLEAADLKPENLKAADNKAAEETFTFDPIRPPTDSPPHSRTPAATETEQVPSELDSSFQAQQTAQLSQEQEAAPPPKPSPSLDAVPAAITAFFTGGNLLVKAGIIILFFGVSFLVKYAAEHGLIPIELRLAACALGGAALLATGWSLRNRRPEYSLTLQGGGIGVLYLTCYAAFRLYYLIPAFPAFALLLAISLLCGALAVLQDSRTLALFGISGGFLAPLLASTGQGSHVFLFGYYVALNVGIIGIAWFKSWRTLNLAGFIFTFLIGAIWGARYYQPEYYPSTEPFLVLFFLIYVGVAVLFALRQPPELKGYLDGTIVFGTPVVSFALQAMLVSDYRYGLAWSSLIAGLFYILLSVILSRLQSMIQLVEAFRAFGVIFLTLTVPLAFDGRWTAAAWALEGAAIAWLGARQDRPIARSFGYLLQAGAGVAFCWEMDRIIGPLPVLNVFFLGCLLLSLAGLWTSYALYRAGQKVAQWEYTLSQFLIAWGLLWWISGGFSEIDRHVPASFETGVQLVFIAATCAICHLLEARLSWPPMVWPALGIVPALWYYSFFGLSPHPLADGGWFGWPVAFILLYTILYLQDDEPPEMLQWLHAAALWLLAMVVTWELCWQIEKLVGREGSWLTIGRGVVPVLVLLFLAKWGDIFAWPVRRHQNSYLSLAAIPLALWSWLWCLVANFSDRGDPALILWLPFLNPLDLAVALALAALALWYRRFQGLPCRGDLIGRPFGGPDIKQIYAATIFVWLNAIMVRGLHHWGGVPFEAQAMFDSNLAQTSFALFWSLLALLVMVVATRRGMRMLWIAGAGLLGVVVVKLFLIDLAGQGSIERIVSFVAVGLLLLVIGWFSPVPPHYDR